MELSTTLKFYLCNISSCPDVGCPDPRKWPGSVIRNWTPGHVSFLLLLCDLQWVPLVFRVTSGLLCLQLLACVFQEGKRRMPYAEGDSHCVRKADVPLTYPTVLLYVSFSETISHDHIQLIEAVKYGFSVVHVSILLATPKWKCMIGLCPQKETLKQSFLWKWEIRKNSQEKTVESWEVGQRSAESWARVENCTRSPESCISGELCCQGRKHLTVGPIIRTESGIFIPLHLSITVKAARKEAARSQTPGSSRDSAAQYLGRSTAGANEGIWAEHWPWPLPKGTPTDWGTQATFSPSTEHDVQETSTKVPHSVFTSIYFYCNLCILSLQLRWLFWSC